MREIKFRVWDNCNKRMLYFGPRWLWDSEYDTLQLEGELNVPAEDNLVFMQYLGLEDKNGKEICEGDIIRVQNEFTRYFSDIRFTMAIYDWLEEIEVIGNVYENPEITAYENPEEGRWGKSHAHN